MRPFTFALDEKDRALLYQTASKMDLPPTVFARALLLRGLRSEAARVNNESGASGCQKEQPGDRMHQ